MYYTSITSATTHGDTSASEKSVSQQIPKAHIIRPMGRQNSRRRGCGSGEIATPFFLVFSWLRWAHFFESTP